MKTIHIDRIDLKCRGIPPAMAQAAASKLSPAIRHQLAHSGAAADSPANAASGVIRVSGNATAATLAGAVAAQVARTVRARAPQSQAPKKL